MKAHLPRLALAAGILAAVLVGAVIAVDAIGDDAAPTPWRAATAAEARDALDTLVALGTGDDPVSVCGELAANVASCRHLAQALDAGPSGPPTVIDEREVASRSIDGGLVQGGRLLVLCGTRADDTTYRTELLVWVDDDGVVVLHPVWWSGVSVVTDGVEPLGDGRVGAVATTADPSNAAAGCTA